MDSQNFCFLLDLNAAENLHPELQMQAETLWLRRFLVHGCTLIRRMQIKASEKERGWRMLDSALGPTRKLDTRGVSRETCDDADRKPSAISTPLLDSTFSHPACSFLHILISSRFIQLQMTPCLR